MVYVKPEITFVHAGYFWKKVNRSQCISIHSKLQTASMKAVLLLLSFLPGLAYSQAPVIEMDTTFSRTRIYAAMNLKNLLYKREEYDLENQELLLTGIILSRLTDSTTTKGCRFYGSNSNWPIHQAEVYIDDNELDGIITTLKYISDSIDLRGKAQHDMWIYYKTVDDFEVGVRAAKGRKFEVYCKKNYRFLVDRSFSYGRINIMEAYKSFVAVRDFLKSH